MLIKNKYLKTNEFFLNRKKVRYVIKKILGIVQSLLFIGAGAGVGA